MKHLVLLGADHVHAQLLACLAQRARLAPLPFRVTLIAPQAQLIDASMLAGLVSGQYTLEECSVALDGLLKADGVNYVQGRVTQIDAARQVVVVAQQEGTLSFEYDALSVNTEALPERELIDVALPGAREHALFLRPSRAFPVLWERLRDLAAQQALRIAVIGSGRAAVELALALKERLPHCAVTLVCGDAAPASDLPDALRQRVLRQLKRSAIPVLQLGCSAIAADHIVLDRLTTLVCDAPVLALAAQPALWLAGSGLALDDQGWIALNEFQQSQSHPQVFATGDSVCGLDAQRGASKLASNLFAALSGLPLTPCAAPRQGLEFLSCGARCAMASWRGWSVQGRWVGYWKDGRARRLLARLRAIH